jgi:DNA-binding NtrC family response regulator
MSATAHTPRALDSDRLVDDGEEVLVVDDDAEFRLLLARRLEALGADAREAASVVEAIDTLEGRHVDVVISDHSMPRASGLNLLAYLVRRGFAGRFVLMSGDLSPETARLARAQGALVVSKWDLLGYL